MSRSALSPVLPSPAKHEEAACDDRSCSSASSLLLLPINVHEMFYTSFHAISRFPAVSQIEHQAWVACCVTAETGGSHTGLAEERSEEHTSELQSLMRISYAVFCLKKKTPNYHHKSTRVTIVNINDT